MKGGAWPEVIFVTLNYCFFFFLSPPLFPLIVVGFDIFELDIDLYQTSYHCFVRLN